MFKIVAENLYELQATRTKTLSRRDGKKYTLKAPTKKNSVAEINFHEYFNFYEHRQRFFAKYIFFSENIYSSMIERRKHGGLKAVSKLFRSFCHCF